MDILVVVIDSTAEHRRWIVLSRHDQSSECNVWLEKVVFIL